MRSFIEVILKHVREKPDATAYGFFKGPSLVPDTLTYRNLWVHSASLAHFLQSCDLHSHRALIVCKSQKNFVIAFFACLLAGTVAVPTAPPKRKFLLDRLKLLTNDAKALAIITDCDELLQSDVALDKQIQQLVDMQQYMRREDHEELSRLWLQPDVSNDTIAFLQYTSGSTGDPKGVVITHSNLLNNCVSIKEGMAVSDETKYFGALPLFHDMGLVGGVLASMYSGCVATFMSPVEAVEYPERWLQIISKFKVTISGAPNFMYELATRTIQVEQIPDIDLSSWQVAFCGAEPIRANTITGFTQRFMPFGFKPHAFYPCYGMAEATLFITGSRLDASPSIHENESNQVVGCGFPTHDTCVEIVDPDTCQRVPEGHTGEIWVSGSSVAKGYWMRPDLTKEYFQSFLIDHDLPFLRTGDIGHVNNGELYVSGRLKDLIIVYGKKYAPQDLEDEAERSHNALRQYGGAAFSITKDGTERVVVVFELKREWLRRPSEWSTIVRSVRTSLIRAFSIALHDVVLIKPGALPRTSSGKVRRSESRSTYLADGFERCLPPTS